MTADPVASPAPDGDPRLDDPAVRTRVADAIERFLNDDDEPAPDAAHRRADRDWEADHGVPDYIRTERLIWGEWP